MTRDWVAATGTSRGAHHVHADLPNEDHARRDTDTAPAVVTVADGHGAPRYTRAQRGSRLATRAAVDVLRSHHGDLDRLPSALVDRWRELVAADVATDPPARGELAQRRPFELYGTTVLAAADLGSALLLVQLGDGDIVLAACGTGDVRRPIPPVEQPFPGATDSLVQPDAAAAVRVALVDTEDLDPDLVVLATDGLDAAQPTAAWHASVGATICRDVAGRPPTELSSMLATICERAAAAGGDDTTMAVLVRRRVLRTGGS